MGRSKFSKILDTIYESHLGIDAGTQIKEVMKFLDEFSFITCTGHQTCVMELNGKQVEFKVIGYANNEDSIEEEEEEVSISSAVNDLADEDDSAKKAVEKRKQLIPKMVQKYDQKTQELQKVVNSL